MAFVASVLVDEPGLDREFSYLLPDELIEKLKQQPGNVPLRVGTIVRVKLQQRRMRGWIMRLETEDDYAAEHAHGFVTGHSVSAEHSASPAKLESLVSVVGIGPPPHVVELTKWAANRWAGTRVHFMRAASPERVVRNLPKQVLPTSQPESQPAKQPNKQPNPSYAEASNGSLDNYLSGDFSANPPSVIQISPSDDWLALTEQVCELGRVLVLTPTLRAAHRLAGQLESKQVSVAIAPKEWEKAAAAQVVLGARGAAWAPAGPLEAVVVFDEHDQSYQSEAAPTWHARTVAMQRALVDGAKCFLVSPAPSPDAIHFGQLTDLAVSIDTASSTPTSNLTASSTSASNAVVAEESAERATTGHLSTESLSAGARSAWPLIEIVDRRGDDPMAGEWCSDRLARVITDARPAANEASTTANTGSTAGDSAQPGRVVCVLNRKGRARLAICRDCGELARNETTGTALKIDGDELIDPQTGEARPIVCASCGSLKFRRARLGVKGVAAELEALARQRVVQATSDNPQTYDDEADFFIGTEAVLHRVPTANVVAFLDFDQELTAPRYRAEEEAMALLVLAARMVGGDSNNQFGKNMNSEPGRVLVQTRQPDHPVLIAATSGKLLEWSARLLESRRKLRQPPYVSWALISGAAAEEYINGLHDFAESRGLSNDLEIASTSDGVWRVRSRQPDQLHAALTRTARPKGRLRVAIDPVRA